MDAGYRSGKLWIYTSYAIYWNFRLREGSSTGPSFVGPKGDGPGNEHETSDAMVSDLMMCDVVPRMYPEGGWYTPHKPLSGRFHAPASTSWLGTWLLPTDSPTMVAPDLAINIGYVDGGVRRVRMGTFYAVPWPSPYHNRLLLGAPESDVFHR